MLKSAVLCFIVLLLGACTASPILKTSEITKAHPVGPANYYGASLSSGQILVSEYGDPISLLLSLFPTQFSPFIHAGIVVIEDGVPYVYDVGATRIREEGTSSHAVLVGYVSRYPLERFVRGHTYVAIYDVPVGIDPKKVASFAQEQYRIKRPFDSRFDARDHKQLYCAELVAAALEAGGAQPAVLTPVRNNTSFPAFFNWLDTSVSGLIMAGNLIKPERHVATFSTYFTPKQLHLYQAAKGEIHRRYTADQKLGNVFQWTGMSLKYRAAVEGFLSQTLDLLPAEDEITEEDAQEAVAALAALMFGSFDPVMSLVSDP